MGDYAYGYVPYGGKLISYVLPCSDVQTSEKTAERNRAYPVTEILKENYKEDFHSAVSRFVSHKPETFAGMEGFKSDTEDTADLRFENRATRVLYVESVLNQPTHATIVDVIVRSEIRSYKEGQDSKGNQMWTYTGKRQFVDFRLRYMLDMRLCRQKCLGPVVGVFRILENDLLREEGSLKMSDHMVPVIHDKDYDGIGRNVLEKYYPEALNDPEPTKVRGEILASRMGLKVLYARLPENSNVFGQLYFGFGRVEVLGEGGRPETMIMQPGTILINETQCRNYAVRNSTIIHECCHLYLNRPFFLLQCMTGRKYSCIVNRKKENSRRKQRKTPVDWMEFQAEKLPAYILMEKENTIRVIEKMLLKYGNDRSPEVMRKIMQALADRFGVSRTMAKIRMKELGYREAEGIYNYIERQPVPDHGCGGNWPEGIIFTISPENVRRLSQSSPAFVSEINSRGYAYVEGHLCLDQEKYVEHRWRQKARLTEYARHHIEECCIGFTVYGSTREGTYREGVASRLTENRTSLFGNLHMASSPGEKDWEKENRKAAEEGKAWAAVAKEMPCDFRGALNVITKAKGISQEELAARLGIFAVKFELEDLALKYLHPEEYNDLVIKIGQMKTKRETIINNVISEIKESL
ncbi:MAG: hypothetical protein IKX76_01815, partial [Eubacterium sp.]|nr:hypothetical protein [Eubacterium sp.]